MTTSRHDQIMKTFAKRLKMARERAGFRSAQQFAGFIGMEPHSYRKYERGSTEPNFERLVQICEILEIDANYLLPITVEASKTRKGNRVAA